MEVFAGIVWRVEDVQAFRPEWSDEKCRKWLMQNERWFRDQLIEYGNEMLHNALDS